MKALKVWEGIRSIINIKEKRYKNINLKINENISTNSSDIANHFNNFFTTIPSKLAKKIPPTHSDYRSYLVNQNNNSFFLSPTNPNEIESLINDIKLNKAIGPNSIPNYLLKEFKENVSKPLALIFNLSFQNRSFPTAL